MFLERVGYGWSSEVSLLWHYTPQDLISVGHQNHHLKPRSCSLLAMLPACGLVEKSFDMSQEPVSRLEKAVWLLCSFLPRLLNSSSCFPLLQLFWVSGLQGLSPRLLHMAAVLDPTEDSAWVLAPWTYTSEQPGTVVRSALEVSCRFVSNSSDYQRGAVPFQHWLLDTLLCTVLHGSWKHGAETLTIANVLWPIYFLSVCHPNTISSSISWD